MKVNENYYECKLVSVGEQADNIIKKLRDKNLKLTTLLDEKNNNIPEDYKHDLKVYKSRVKNLERTCSILNETIKSKDYHIDDLLNQIGKDEENADNKDQEYVDYTAKLETQNTGLRSQVETLSAKVKNQDRGRVLRIKELKEQLIELQKKVNYLEKIFNEHKYVFSNIPNNDFGREFVDRLEYYLNKKKYKLRKRGQYLVDGEDWRKYQTGQPISKSKCIRVYIDNLGTLDTTEGFNLQEIDLILDGLYYREDKCHEFIDSWGYKGNEKDEDVVNEKSTLKKTLSLIKYFEEMKTHIEECQFKMGETNNVT